MSGWLDIDRRQVGILADRYLDVVLGDLKGTALLLVQAPLIGVAIAGVWSNISRDSEALYFVLALSAFFFGAVNACREIVKERALFLREKMFNLSVGAYLVSKYRVQAMLILLQCAVLVVIVRRFVPMSVDPVSVGLALFMVALTGTAVGLLVSAWVSTPDRAVTVVPLLVIPQILFSDFVLGSGQLSNWTATAEKLMPVHWAYRALTALRDTNTEWFDVLGGAVVLTVMICGAFFAALAMLRASEY